MYGFHVRAALASTQTTPVHFGLYLEIRKENKIILKNTGTYRSLAIIAAQLMRFNQFMKRKYNERLKVVAKMKVETNFTVF